MRITQEIRRTILRNLVADHAVSAEAKHVMDLSQALAMDVIRDQMPKGVTTMAQLQNWKETKLVSVSKTAFFSARVYEDYATYSVSDGQIAFLRDATFAVNFNGLSRTLFAAGDNWHRKVCNGYTDKKYTDQFSPHVGDIVPGYELELFLNVLEVVDGKRIKFNMPRGEPSYAADHDFVKRQDEIDTLRRAVRAVRAKYDELSAVVIGILFKYNSDAKLVEAWPEIAKYIPCQEVKTTAVALDVKTLNAICGLPN